MFLVHSYFINLLIFFVKIVTPSSDNNLPPSLTPDDIDKIVELNKKCIEEMKQNSNLVEKRFTTIQIAFLCKNRHKWIKEAENGMGKMSDVDGIGLTNNQLSWLNKVYSCNNLNSCICLNAECSPTDGNVSKNGSRHKRQLPERVLRPALRKEYRVLTDFERRKFHNALNRMKSDIIDNISKYDLLSIYHTPAYSPGAHWGAAFLPFHRELLKQLETSLRFYDNSVALPYWDSTLDEGLPDPRNSILWTDAFLGNGEGYVETGPFQKWNATSKIQDQQRLFRDVGRASFGGLYRNDDVKTILSKSKFEQLTACVDPFFELLHGTVHMWVGGYMLDIPLSPNDPSFYLHHTFVDYMWEQFRLQNQDRINRQNDYPTEDKCCNSNHFMGSFMLPFKIRNIDGLANSYTDNFYVYEPRPVCSEIRPSCNSPYLFCDKKKFRCLSKITEGGNCTGFEDTDICYNSLCIDKICKASDEVKSSINGNEVRKDTGTEKPTLSETTTHVSWTTDIIPISITMTPKQTEHGDEKSSDPTLITQIDTSTATSAGKSVCSCSCDCPTDEPFSFALNEKIKPNTEPQTSANGTKMQKSQNSEVEFAKQKDSSINETNFEYLWFTITVLKGGVDNMFKDQINANVVLKGVDYDEEFVTNVSMRNGYPFYPGATLIRVKSPVDGHGTAQLSANYDSTICTPYCYQNSAINYVKCAGKLEIDAKVNSTSADSLILYNNESQALTKPWNGRLRKPDYLMFLCQEDIQTKKLDDCMFVRLENFMLVGHSDVVEEGQSLEYCKKLCRDSETKFKFKCLSLIYWTKRKSCVITKESRLTKPALFGHFPNESAIYMDYVCKIDTILER